jgi:dolichol kinase
MVIALCVSIAIVLGLVFASELLWRWGKIHPEYTRKFLHITAGSFVAFWPYYLSRNDIIATCAVVIVIVSISRYFKVFKAMHSVQRPTWGEALYVAAVGTGVVVAQNHWIFSVALLMVSLADGLAAVIGTRFGKTNSYHIPRALPVR